MDPTVGPKYRVAWRRKRDGEVFRGAPLSERDAQAWADAMNDKHGATAEHWIEPVETCGAYYVQQGGPGVVTVTNVCRLPITHTGPHGQP